MKTLVIAPHADDETLGVGGTIARRVHDRHEVVVAVLTGHGDASHPIWPKDHWVDIRKECDRACRALGVAKVIYRDLPAACLDHTPTYQTNDAIGAIIEEAQPDEMFIPFAGDLHRDHAAVAYGVTVATRPYQMPGRNVKRIFAYETLSETHLAPAYLSASFQPNVFVDISSHLETKLAAMREYKSQLCGDDHPRSLRSIRALAEFRGAHAGVAAAEAFVLIRELA